MKQETKIVIGWWIFTMIVTILTSIYIGAWN